MFSFKSICVLLAAASTFVSAMPTANSDAGVAKRDPVALAEPVALPILTARGGPATIPDCVNTYNAAVAPIFVQIGEISIFLLI